MLADMDGGKAGYLRWVLRPLRAAFSMRIMVMTFLLGLVLHPSVPHLRRRSMPKHPKGQAPLRREGCRNFIFCFATW